MIVILFIWMLLRWMLALGALIGLAAGVLILFGFVSSTVPWWQPFLAGWVLGFIGMLGDGLIGWLGDI